MYKYYEIYLQIRWYNCEDVLRIVRTARSLKEAGFRARQAVTKYQRIFDEARVCILNVHELVSE